MKTKLIKQCKTAVLTYSLQYFPVKMHYYHKRGYESDSLPVPVQLDSNQNSLKSQKCACECDSKLDKYITEFHPDSNKVIRRGNIWVAYLSTSDHKQYMPQETT